MDDEARLVATAGKIARDEFSWEPLYTTVRWKDLLGILVILPSGVTKKDLRSLTVSVEEDRREIVVTATWPKFAFDVKAIEASFARSKAVTSGKTSQQDLNHIATVVKDRFATLRKSEPNLFESVCRIPLQIQISRKFHDLALLGDADEDTRVFFVDLKDEDSTTATVI